jgi:hypothetical protein
MEAPICKICGERHWSRLCYAPRNAPVTKAVTAPERATPKLVAPSQLAAALTENEALRAEVVMLKQKLSEANGGARAAASASERMKKMRAKKKAGK